MMKVELCQSVSSAADGERAAFREVELDGVPIVDDRVGPFAPADVERGWALTGRTMSRGDCWTPVEHIPFAASRVPHLSGPVAP